MAILLKDLLFESQFGGKGLLHFKLKGQWVTCPAVVSLNTREGESPYRITFFGGFYEEPDMQPMGHLPIDRLDANILMKGTEIDTKSHPVFKPLNNAYGWETIRFQPQGIEP